MANLPESPVWHDEIYRLEKRTLVVGGEPQFDEAGNPTGGYSNVPHKQMADRTQWLRERIGEKLQVVEDIDALRLVDPRLLYYGQFLSIVTYGSGQFNDGVVEYYYWDPVSQIPDDGYDVIKPSVPLVSGRWLRITNQTSDDIIAEMRQLLEDSQTAAQQSLQYSQNAAQYAQQAGQSAESANLSAQQAASYNDLYVEYLDRATAGAELSEAWAQSPTPPDPSDITSKSSKTWSLEAKSVIDQGVLDITDLKDGIIADAQEVIDSGTAEIEVIQQEAVNVINTGVAEITVLKDQATDAANRANASAVSAGLEADRAETIAEQIASSPEAANIFDTLALATAAAATLPDNTLLLVMNDGDNNGNYLVKSGLPSKTEYQTVTQPQLDEFKESVEDDILGAGISSGTPKFVYYEFYNEYPINTYFSDKGEVLVDSVGAVIGHVTEDGIWDLNGIGDSSNSSQKTYEFHNTYPGLEDVSVANTDSNQKVFASFNKTGVPTYLGGGSVQPGTDKFELDPLNQLLFLSVYGQSLSVGAQGQPPLSTVQPYSNRTFGAGPKSTKAGSVGSNPGTDTTKLLIEDSLNGDGGEGGNRGETVCSGTANYASLLLSQDGIDPNDCIFFSATAGHGGYSITQLEEGTTWFQVWKDHITEAALRATEMGRKLVVPVIIWIQGETDAGMQRQLYATKLIALRKAMISHIKSVTGQVWEPPMHTYQNWASRTVDNEGSASALLWLARNMPTQFRLVTPTYRFPHAADGTHLINIGYKWMGAFFGRSTRDVILNLEPNNYVMPGIPIKIDNSTIQIPVKSGSQLQFSGNTFQRGFGVLEGAIEKDLSVDIQGQNIMLSLNTPLADDVFPVVTYARQYKDSAMLPLNGGTGDLCDTDESEIIIAGTAYSMKTYCPSFRQQCISNNI